MKRIGPLLVLACLLLLPCRPAAGEWTADIVDTQWVPPRFVAVDKMAQTFTLLTRHSPLRVVASIPCATGQELGDKSKEGDLKTPEGVYFITRRKTNGLNFDLYGDLAFPLDFPNPADLVRHKSGHGIWIHGRGHAITPFETQGCVAMNTPDLHRMDPELAEGMPVIIADEVRMGGAEAAKLKTEAREVVEATKAWAKAWEDRSARFFEFHDPEKFALSEGQPFSMFKNHKERLFKVLPWIQVSLYDVRALPGPDYWVTYFVQLYRSPTLISKGVKRLYWQRDAAGRFRIIGMEYEEMPVTLADRGKAPKAAPAPDEQETDTRKPDASSEEDLKVARLSDAHTVVVEQMAQKAFHALTLKAQPTPEDQAILDVARNGATKPGVSPFATDAAPLAPAAPAAPTVAAAPAVPAKPEPTVLAMAKTPEKAPVQPQPASKPEAKAAAKPEPAAAAAAAAKEPAPAKPQAPAAAEVAPAKPAVPVPAAELAAWLERWRQAWEQGRLDAYLAFYDEGARMGGKKGREAIGRQKADMWRTLPPERVGITLVAVAPEDKGFTAVCAESYQAKGRRVSKGYKIVTLVPSQGSFRIVNERWSRGRPAPMPGEVAVDGAALVKASPATASVAAPAASKPATPPQAAAKEDRTAAVTAFVEAWRKAWESGDLDAYMAFYAPDAVQGDEHGREAIRVEKAGLWDGKAPRSVRLRDIRVTPRQEGFVVSAVQDYEDKTGGRDHGRKTLVVVPSGKGFTITDEQWSRM